MRWVSVDFDRASCGDAAEIVEDFEVCLTANLTFTSFERPAALNARSMGMASLFPIHSPSNSSDSPTMKVLPSIPCEVNMGI